MRGGGYQIQSVVPFTPMVKRLIILNVAIWIGLIMILQNMILKDPALFYWFGVSPALVVEKFFIWQPFTYMFFHSTNIFHMVFNMLMLWWLGAELEQRWGSRFFLLYYFVCGTGASLLYTICTYIYYASTGDDSPLTVPVIGASGAVFGLILAYGKYFGERIIYFFMIFPMKAKYFVMILGGIELVSLLNSGLTSQVSNLSHLGGLVAGFLFLYFWNNYSGRKLRKNTKRHGRKLKLVVDNDNDGGDTPPRYWN